MVTEGESDSQSSTLGVSKAEDFCKFRNNVTEEGDRKAMKRPPRIGSKIGHYCPSLVALGVVIGGTFDQGGTP